MAKEYDEETIDFWQRFPQSFLDTFARLAQGKILNIGSGPGRDGLLLKERGFEVICLDASEAMIQLCQEKGLQSVVGDFIALPFENNSFDGAWAYTSLLHVPKADISKALHEIQRILKVGGVLGLGLIEGETEEYRTSSGVNMPRWFSFYTKKEIEKILAEHNLNVLYFEQFQPHSKNYLHVIAQKQE